MSGTVGNEDFHPTELDLVQEQLQKFQLYILITCRDSTFLFVFIYLFINNKTIRSETGKSRHTSLSPRAAPGLRKLEIKVERVTRDWPYLEEDYSNPIIFTITTQRS